MDTESIYSLFSNIIIGLMFCFLIHSVYKYYVTYSFWSSRGIQGPIPLPIVGNSLTYIFNSIPEMDQLNLQKYGRMYGIYDGSIPVLMISDPEMIEKVFITDHNSFKYHVNIDGDFEFNNDFMAGSLFFKRGEEFKRARAMFTSGMTMAKLKNYLTMIDCDDLIKFLHESNGKLINVYDVVTLQLLNAITKIFFGLDLDLFQNQNSQWVQSAKTLFDFGNSIPSFIYSHCPYLSMIYYYFDPSVQAHRSIRKLVKYAIDEREKQLRNHDQKDGGQTNVHINHSKKNIDFLQQMIDSNLPSSEQVDNGIVAIGAGFDSTSSTLCHLLYELGINPDILMKLRNEVDEIFNNQVDDDQAEKKELAFEELSNMTYLENCFTETLRLHPSDVRIYRSSSTDTKIPMTKTTIPASTFIQVPLYALHYDTEIFDNAKEFNPDRWLSESTKKKCSFMTFGAGPRKCPGGQLALMIFKLVIVHIIRNFDLEVSKDSNVRVPAGKVFSNPTNIRIKFTPRTIART